MDTWLYLAENTSRRKPVRHHFYGVCLKHRQNKAITIRGTHASCTLPKILLFFLKRNIYVKIHLVAAFSLKWILQQFQRATRFYVSECFCLCTDITCLTYCKKCAFSRSFITEVDVRKDGLTIYSRSTCRHNITPFNAWDSVFALSAWLWPRTVRAMKEKNWFIPTIVVSL